MKTIYLVRHGEAEHNVRTDVYRNAPSSQLTEKGHEQAKFIAERAVHLKIDALLSSPYERTRQTAEYISEKIGLPIELCDAIHEVAPPSSLEGMPFTEDVVALDNRWLQSVFTSERVLDGENFDDVVIRVREARALLEARPEKNLLLVSHGMFARFFMAYVLFGDELTQHVCKRIAVGFRTRNTGVTVLKYNPADGFSPWHVLVWNDHAHLAE